MKGDAKMFTENEEIISKADVLVFLKSHLSLARVEDIEIINAGVFLENPEEEAERIRSRFQGDTVVVRSSSVKEDSMVTSNAGHFDSVLNVDSGSLDDIIHAVRHVLSTYQEDGTMYDGFLEEQVLVQRQAKDIRMSGVVFTRDLLYNRPYFMINYDDDGSTDSVTAGKSGRTVYVPWNTNEKKLKKPFGALISAIREILSLCSIEYLDIEFGITAKGDVIIFQTRPLAAVAHMPKIADDAAVMKAREKAEEDFGKLGHALSDMAFWNPSEIIGDNPFPLDYSLYREIITAYIWSAGISAIGYHYINDDLMYRIGNKPYISIDYTFEGLIPELLTPALQKKLKRYYQKRLREDISAHDKIEFEIVFSAYDFCTEENMDVLLGYGFTKNEINEIQKSLYFVTCMALQEYPDIYAEDMTSLYKMRELRHQIRDKKPLEETDIDVIKDYIGELLTSIKSDGTPQFSRQARLAFMARSFCRTLVQKGYIKEDDMDAYMLSINTVASDFERDFDAYSHGMLSRDEFNSRYGHLRLGTYNVRTDCYAKMYFDVGTSNLKGTVKSRPKAKELDKNAIRKALLDHEIGVSEDDFIDFIRKTTENREFFKFEFTKSLSLALELIIRLGQLYGIPRDDLSFLTVMDIFNYETKGELEDVIAQSKMTHRINSGLILPEVVFSKEDIGFVQVADSRPNFITAGSAEGEVVLLDDFADEPPEIEGKIVVVTKADPGYDWIFTKNIAGFITRYGGAASHMAIRCAEFDIPAAIGCGEKIFNDVRGMKYVRIDCLKKQIQKVKGV